MNNGFRSIAILTSLLMGGCGGGGGGAPDLSGTAEGQWVGTTSTGREINGVVLDDGTYWVIYSMAGNSTVIAGVVQGTGTSSNNDFSSSNAKDFNFEGLGVNNASVAANYAASSTFDGSITYPGLGQTVTFNSAYDIVYDQTPSLANVAGVYAGTAITDGGNDSATVTITGGGVLTGISGLGCAFNGAVTLHGSGNVYDISVTFGGGNCANGTSTVTGIAVLDSVTKTVYSAALNNSRTNGFLYVGTKP